MPTRAPLRANATGLADVVRPGDLGRCAMEGVVALRRSYSGRT